MTAIWFLSCFIYIIDVCIQTVTKIPISIWLSLHVHSLLCQVSIQIGLFFYRVMSIYIQCFLLPFVVFFLDWCTWFIIFIPNLADWLYHRVTIMYVVYSKELNIYTGYVYVEDRTNEKVDESVMRLFFFVTLLVLRTPIGT